ncbi:MAG: AtpZ/AtpI family protein [Pseudomonadota bacterium]|uniref:AtpZ/AtpI family protein n=1 Tax=Candidatus Desulfatibia profunda TaxID=2841695 RepID=A0A8J6NWF7_9BACT|nr:AtpZ/AtpI family protein [Candidatus Desulfatibia profunda]MBL7180590.1 AtpZ/AtpI family protein [Desulfobacterales bacterium]MBU0699561.1 AtpZ/AtpI family protein [Pseudomonadota bacterium]
MFFNFKKNRAWIKDLSIITQLGLTMAGCILFCFFIGRYLDKFFGTKGILVAIFTVLGIIGGGVVVYRQILEVTEVKEESENHSNNGNA